MNVLAFDRLEIQECQVHKKNKKNKMKKGTATINKFNSEHLQTCTASNEKYITVRKGIHIQTIQRLKHNNGHKDYSSDTIVKSV